MMPRRLMVRLRTLTPSIEVRILTGHPASYPLTAKLARCDKKVGRPLLTKQRFDRTAALQSPDFLMFLWLASRAIAFRSSVNRVISAALAPSCRMLNDLDS